MTMWPVYRAENHGSLHDELLLNMEHWMLASWISSYGPAALPSVFKHKLLAEIRVNLKPEQNNSLVKRSTL